MSLLNSVLDNTEIGLSTPIAPINNIALPEFEVKHHYGLTSARLAPDCTIVPTDEQWLVAANLDWTIDSVEENYFHNGVMHTSADKINVRSDTSEKLGNSSAKYKIVQPAEIVHFFRDLSDHYGATLKQVGYADGGKRVYAYAQVGTEFEIGKGDRTLSHLLLLSSSDGSTATIAQPFFESLYCFNQLPAARRLIEPVKIRHNTVFDPRQVKLDMGLYGEAQDKMRESLINMSRKSVTNQEALSLLYNCLKVADDITKESKRNINRVISVYDKYTGSGIAANEPGRKGTMWGVLNAITEFTDHDQCNSENSRWKSKTTGEGAKLKASSFDYLDAICQEKVEFELIELPA